MQNQLGYFKALTAVIALGLAGTACEMVPENDIEGNESYSATVQSPNILYQETFEESDPFSFATMQYAESYGFGVTKSPVFSGDFSGRFELNDTDDMASNGTRAEALFPRMSEKERWYSYTLYLPSADYKIDSNYDIISQWHQGAGTGSPTLTFRVTNDRFQLEHGDHADNRKKYDLAPVQKDQWMDVVFHVVHSSGSDGLVEIWLDGQKVIDLEGGNMDARYDLPRWKMGIYKDDWNGSETTDSKRRVLFFDNVRLGNKDASFEEMSSMGESPAPNPEPDPEDGNEVPSEGPIKSLTLINTSSDEPVGDFQYQATIGAKDHRLSIVPNFEEGSEPVEVKFDLSGTSNRSSIDDAAPFSLSGDDGAGNFWYGEGLYPGDYELSVTPFYNVNGQKVAGPVQTFSFTITAADENAILESTSMIPHLPDFDVNSLTLINTSSDKAIGEFNSGAKITAKDHRLSIVPNYEGTTPAEVLLELSGEAERDNLSESAPFSLSGDNGNGNYWYGEGLYPGDYQLKITPYFEIDGEKVAGESETFSFAIISGKKTSIN
ncbi:polysaccharide lyase [Echinicola salinicaeni]|uniref:polysaccharide lyase n=1 Tax=Echinicola salinicaeni TaxID=2762757 RepID=UPI0016458091|nr:polysaccharide lyase [Echinicola salinicaeni]